LRKFRTVAFDYFQNIQHVPRHIARQPIMNEKSQKARQEMNLMMKDVVLCFDLLGITHYVRYTPPPMIGGYIQDVDILANIFSLSGFDISAQTVFDGTDRAIGACENECRRLLRKSFNPLYWLGLLVGWVFHLPFKLLAAAGFDANRFEGSILGKTLKLIWALILSFAAIIPAILETSDHWSKIQEFLHKCVAALHGL